ncbi:hypothetical protein KY285_033303 [Solanum tuberosum]|nr:hypothetical protein KY285_033303 [Solanum tuberosum]
MASRCRAFSRPAINFVKSTMNKQSSIPTSSFNIPRPFPTLSRQVLHPMPLPQMGCLQSLLPLHTAVSSARLTSCLGIDSKGSRSLSQDLRSSSPQFFASRNPFETFFATAAQLSGTVVVTSEQYNHDEDEEDAYLDLENLVEE